MSRHQPRLRRAWPAPALALCTLVLLGCPAAQPVPDAVPAPPAPGFTEANAAALLAANAEATIERARLAQERATRAEVRQFAANTIAQYEAWRQQATRQYQARGISPTRETTADRLMTNHRQTMEALRAWTGEDFDRAYIATEVTMHRWMVEALDRSIVPATRDRAIRGMLEQMRTPLAQHLREAERLQGMVGHPPRTG